MGNAHIGGVRRRYANVSFERAEGAANHVQAGIPRRALPRTLGGFVGARFASPRDACAGSAGTAVPCASKRARSFARQVRRVRHPRCREQSLLKERRPIPNIETFFDPITFTLTYVVFGLDSKDAVVIDPATAFRSA